MRRKRAEGGGGLPCCDCCWANSKLRVVLLDEITSRSFNFSSLSEEAALSALYSSISLSRAAILLFNSAIIFLKNNKQNSEQMIYDFSSISSGLITTVSS